MVKDIINLETLNMAELTGVVTIYPWYAQARMELCRRMAELGEGGWSDQRFAEEALYLGSRKLLYSLLDKRAAVDLTDHDLAQAPVAAPQAETAEAAAPDVVEQSGAYIQQDSRVIVVGGDYFSQADYEGAREEGDNFLASLKPGGSMAAALEETQAEEFSDFCTESLAEVYMAQGYTDAARQIYSQLSLRYPEKSVYFAALIEKIDKNI